MYNPRQPHITSGVNGGRFASYGQPNAGTGGPKVGHARDHRGAASKGTPKRKGVTKASVRPRKTDKQLKVSPKGRAKAGHAMRAAHGKRH